MDITQPEISEGEKEVRTIYSQWKERYSHKIEELLKSPDLTRAKLVEVIWEDGILAHIAPVDKDEQAARELLNRDVWKSRDDPDLYWRILYSAQNIDYGIKHHLSIISGFVGGEVVQSVSLLIQDQDKYIKVFPRDRNGKAKDPYLLVIGDIIKKAEDKLKSLGEKPHKPLFKMGDKGIFKGIPVTIDAISYDGKIALQAGNYNDQGKLWDYSNGHYGAIPPQELTSKNFTKVVRAK